jgi:peroxiredoxin
MKTGLVIIAVIFSITAHAQLDSAMRQLARETDPQQTVLLVNKIIGEYKIEDSEMLDILYGAAAVNFALGGNYSEFEKYIGRIQSKFNQTSFMNMAAEKMLLENADPAFALRLAERTLRVYNSYKSESTARPTDVAPADWQRFMRFAQYPYHDTYAHALFKLKRYEEALSVQEKAFEGDPLEGVPASVERYARLLELNGKRADAKKLLLKMAARGRLNRGMTEQLQSIYIAERGNDDNLAHYIDSLQRDIQASIMKELEPVMLHEPAPDFTLKDINGKSVSLSDFRGKTVVLDLWATWCAPCIASFPAMQLMVEKHPEVVFLFIAVQEKEEGKLSRVKSFMERREFPFTVLLDELTSKHSNQYKIISSYQPNGIPAKYIIDKNGILRFTTAGFDTDAALMNELEAMIAILSKM